MVEDNKILTLVYTFFLGLLLAIFIGVGINTFYPAPEQPKYPNELSMNYEKAQTEEQLAEQRKYDQEMQTFYEDKIQPYNRDVSIMTMIGAILLLVVSFVVEKRGIKVIANGTMLGGLFTLVYSIGRGFASDDSKYVFAVVTIGLAIVLYLGFYRFVQGRSPVKKK